MIEKNKVFIDGDLIKTLPDNLKSYIEKNNLTSNSEKTVQFVGFIELDDIYFFLPKSFTRETDKRVLNILVGTLNRYSGKTLKGEVPSCIVGENTLGEKAQLSGLILKDWIDHGYINEKSNVDFKNGKGKINWKKTISNSTPFETNSGLIYFDYVTREVKNPINSRIIEIQKKVVAECDKKFHWIISQKPLAMELHEFIISKDEIDSDILFLQKYLRSAYSERLMRIVALMINFLSLSREKLTGTDLCYGTRYFDKIWEDICKSLLSRKEDHDLIFSLLPQPSYFLNGKLEDQGNNKQRPDVLFSDDQSYYILDAKYYDLKKTRPGWPDLVKQFFYSWSLRESTQKKVVNALLFPSAKFSNVGEINLQNDNRIIHSLGMIKCIELPIIDYMTIYSDYRIVKNSNEFLLASLV